MSILIVSVNVNVPVSKAWSAWTNPEDIKKWNFARDDWHCPKATNNLKIGKDFVATMAAKDGSASFDFTGTYTNIEKNKLIEYTIIGGRKVSVKFKKLGENTTQITEIFDAETENSKQMQKNGWQSILNNFKKHVEGM